jgi:putative membrane protein
MIFYLVIGIILGTIAGLIPGIHTNNITRIAFLTPLFGNEAIVFIVSMVVTQSFVDFIPAIFIGAAGEGSFEGILPGHRMFLQGKAHEAIVLTVFGGITATIISIICFPFFVKFIEYYPRKFELIIPIILIFAIITLIITENNFNKKVIAIFIIFAAATQGMLFQNQIFPLISGYFGIPTLLNTTIKKRENIIQSTKIELKNNNIFDSLTGIIGGAIVAFVPGIGNNLAAAIIRLFRQKIKTKNYLVLLGSINTSNFIFSLPVLIFLSKTRNGAMIFLKERIILTEQTILISIITILISAGIAGIITITISKKLSKQMNNQKFTQIQQKNIIEKIVIIFIIIIVLIFNGIIGIIALLFSTALGIITIQTKTKRSNCLAFLIIPVLFFYLFKLL